MNRYHIGEAAGWVCSSIWGAVSVLSTSPTASCYASIVALVWAVFAFAEARGGATRGS